MRSLFSRCLMLGLAAFIHVQLWYYNTLRCGNWHACSLRHIGWSLKGSFRHLASYTSSSRAFNYAPSITLVVHSHSHHRRLRSGCLLAKSEKIPPLSWRHSFI